MVDEEPLCGPYEFDLARFYCILFIFYFFIYF